MSVCIRLCADGVLIPSLTAAATHAGSSSTSLLAQPQQLFQHLSRFRGLLSKQSVSTALHQELEVLSKLVMLGASCPPTASAC
jgi:hypothetical protein